MSLRPADAVALSPKEARARRSLRLRHDFGEQVGEGGKLACHLMRAPVNLSRLRYHPHSGLIVYEPKAGHDIDLAELTDPLEFLARVLIHGGSIEPTGDRARFRVVRSVVLASHRAPSPRHESTRAVSTVER